MTRGPKLILGLVASLFVAWLWHAPLGNGLRLVDGLDGQARAVVAEAAVPGVSVRMEREPLARVAVLSGPADEFQRYGYGSYKGLTQLVEQVPGMASARWADRPRGLVIPLLAEVFGLALLAYAIGLGLAWYAFGRKKRDRFA